EISIYPLVENHHRSGILRLSLAPAPRLAPDIQRAAERAAHRILESLKYAGVLAIEFFEHRGELLANEMAPRVHNSGHWTIEGAVTNQFENHLRAVLGLPLGSTGLTGHSAMLTFTPRPSPAIPPSPTPPAPPPNPPRSSPSPTLISISTASLPAPAANSVT